VRHRNALAIPFVLLALVTLVGGIVNGVDARGRVVDDFTDKGIARATIQHGIRSTVSDAEGNFTLPSVPRTSRMRIDASGYLRTGAPPTQEEIRMSPLSVTIYVTEEGKAEPDNQVAAPQARSPEGDKLLATGTATGQITVIPHPGRNAKLLICAEGFAQKEITVEGVLMQITLARGTPGCPPLPSPSPSPGATPSPTAPAPSPSPSPAATPSPTASP
jgi:hypothetical protein